MPIKKTKTTDKAGKTKRVAVKKEAENESKDKIKRINKVKEIDIGTKIITGEEIKPVKKKKPKKTAVKKTDQVSINIDTDYRTKKKKVRKKYYTHDGHELTLKEYKFIDSYISTGNGRQSILEAGYESKAPSMMANSLLHKDYIAHEVEWRMTQEHQNRIASGQEVMEFFTKVMNGEVKDQFELDAPLSERLKAANELAKRTVDIANKVAGVTQGQNEVTIKLDWSRRGTE